MGTTTWYATRTSGKFREGRFYTKDELGILGRMAIRAGVLVPTQQTALKAAKKAVAVKPRQRRGATDAEASVQAGGSAEVRDDSGA